MLLQEKNGVKTAKNERKMIDALEEQKGRAKDKYLGFWVKYLFKPTLFKPTRVLGSHFHFQGSLRNHSQDHNPMDKDVVGGKLRVVRSNCPLSG